LGGRHAKVFYIKIKCQVLVKTKMMPLYERRMHNQALTIKRVNKCPLRRRLADDVRPRTILPAFFNAAKQPPLMIEAASYTCHRANWTPERVFIQFGQQWKQRFLGLKILMAKNIPSTLADWTRL
jgi:hypothetical protein